MDPSKEQLNRFIAGKVLGWESYSKVSIHPEWFSNDGCECLVGEEDFFNPEGLAMVLDACTKMESDPKSNLSSISINRHHGQWFFSVYMDPDLRTSMSVDKDFDRALFTALYSAFGGE